MALLECLQGSGAHLCEDKADQAGPGDSGAATLPHITEDKSLAALAWACLHSPSSDACRLGATCRCLHASVDEARAEWDGARGKWSDGLVWLHPLTSFTKSSAFAELTTRLQITGSSTFQTEAELDAFAEALALEAPENVCSRRFIVEWRLGGNQCLDHFVDGNILSEPIQFSCAYGITFDVQLSISVPADEGSSAAISLNIEFGGGSYWSPVEVAVSGAIFGAGFLPEVQVRRGLNSNPTETGALSVDRNTAQQLLGRGWQTAILRVEVPRWCRPVTLASDASSKF